MDEKLIQQYMQGDSRERAKHHLKTLELYDKAIEQLEAERTKVAELKDILRDVLSDCYLSDGMRSEIERLIIDGK